MPFDIHRPIRTEEEYEDALKAISALSGSPEGGDRADLMDVIGLLVADYEDREVQMPPADPLECIHFMLEQRGMTRHDLVPLLGSRSRVSEVLNRKRPLSLQMMRALNEKLGIPYEVLVTPYPLESKGATDPHGKGLVAA